MYAKFVFKQSLNYYDVMFVPERERERQPQVTIKPKHTFAPIGRAIFK
jgi:hypothetical protein